MRVAVVGTGYVGLVTGACFAESGNDVWCVDNDAEKVDLLKSGIMPIFEPGLQELVTKNAKAKRLNFTTELKEAADNALFIFITVGTPPNADGSADLSQVFAVAHEIGELIEHYTVIVDKSTVPVGTAEKVRQIVKDQLAIRDKQDIGFDVVSNPEFLKEGAAIEDFIRPDRIVIGTDSLLAADLMKQLYQPFVRNQHPILVMDIKSAEITKYAANAMLATRISFMNEIARLCDKVGGDIASVRLGIGADNRIGIPFLYAGAGYGGSCFPKDVKELIRTGQKNGIDMKIAQAVEAVNNRQKYYVADMINRYYKGELTGKRIALWGLAFKPRTDDIRDAPSIVTIEYLLSKNAVIIAYDPEAMPAARTIFAQNIEFAADMMTALDNADALVLMTEWRQFRQPDFNDIKRRMRKHVIFDGRNQFDPEQMAKQGFTYFCIGRGCYV